MNGPPGRTRPREEGEEKGQKGGRTPPRRAEGGVAAQPPGRGGRGEGPPRAGAPLVSAPREHRAPGGGIGV